MPHLHTHTTITTALTQAHCLYLTDIAMYPTFAECHTSIPHIKHSTPPPHPYPTAQWNKHSPSMLPHPLATMPTYMEYTSTFTTLNPLHTSNHPLNPRVSHILSATNNDLLRLLRYYNSLIIIAIDGSYHQPIEPIVFPPPHPHTTTAGHATASAVFLAIYNTTQDNTRLNKVTIPLLARIQPLPAAYGTNPPSNNSAKLLARILALALLPPHILAIIIYDSQVVHDLHHNLTSIPYTTRHLARSLYPSISRSLAHRLRHITNTHAHHHCSNVHPPTYLEHITAEILTFIRNLPSSTPDWQPRHITTIHQHTYIKIKSHQLQRTGLPQRDRQPQPFLAHAHANHWADITVDIPTHKLPLPHFPCPTSSYRIRSPLYNPPFVIFYGIYPIDSDMTTFLHQPYQAELLACLATKPEMRWYARHTRELEPPNRTIGYTCPICRLLTH